MKYRNLIFALFFTYALFIIKNADAENGIILEETQFVGLEDRSLHWHYRIDAAQDCNAYSACNNDPYCKTGGPVFEYPGKLRDYLQERLQAGGINVLPTSPKSRGYGVRVYIYDPVCDLNGKAGRFALPFALYSYEKDRVISVIKATVEIYEPITHNLLSSIDLNAKGESSIKTHTILMIPFSKSTNKVSAVNLRRALVEEIVASVKEKINSN